MTPPSANALPRKFPEAHITKIDDEDKGTPDDWVPRHPDLIRLTGRHPLNCEPPLTANYEHGFYLPASLHFVRNHGACPRLAWEQNGKRLLPDHGFPVRLIIPGFIGGRMVKWLTDIQVTEKESTNYYHFFDNRVLPSHVDAEKATAEGWWYKPEYIINDLNINSAMVYPQHDEILELNQQSDQTYTLKGYAYSGGGRKVIRSEISL